MMAGVGGRHDDDLLTLDEQVWLADLLCEDDEPSLLSSGRPDGIDIMDVQGDPGRRGGVSGRALAWCAVLALTAACGQDDTPEPPISSTADGGTGGSAAGGSGGDGGSAGAGGGQGGGDPTCAPSETSAAQPATVTVAPTGDWLAAIKALQPGDIAEFEPGTFSSGAYTYAEKIVTIAGTETQPIVIRGAGTRATTLNGESTTALLVLDDCEHVVVENFVITNPSAFGDGRTDWLPMADGHALAEGLIIIGGGHVTIRHNHFNNIGTRGIFVSSLGSTGLDHLLVEDNLFFNVGLDTASGDVAMGDGVDWTIRYNLFGGNVDGVVVDGNIGSGGVIEHNVFVNHWQEDNVDFKQHDDGGSSVVHHNVFYNNRVAQTGMTTQNESTNVEAYENFFRGGAIVGQFWVHGRGSMGGGLDPVANITIRDSWFDGDGPDSTGRALLFSKTSANGPTYFPVEIENASVTGNFFSQHKDPAIEVWAGVDMSQVTLDNNTFTAPPAPRSAEFEALEQQLMCRLEAAFSTGAIAEVMQEADVPY